MSHLEWLPTLDWCGECVLGKTFARWYWEVIRLDWFQRAHAKDRIAKDARRAAIARHTPDSIRNNGALCPNVAFTDVRITKLCKDAVSTFAAK